MAKPTDIRLVAARVYFLPVETRTPLKFGHETLTSVTCCRVQVTVCDRTGRRAVGWGETPLSVQWAWPADLSYHTRLEAMQRFALRAAESAVASREYGHPIELGVSFQEAHLPRLREEAGARLGPGGEFPYLAALVAISPLDIAVHDAFGQLWEIDVYDGYGAEFISRDLASLFSQPRVAAAEMRGRYPDGFLITPPPSQLPAWHLVGGLDAIDAHDAPPAPAPGDGYPVLLVDWIRRDGLECLKVKLRGNDLAWDLHRLTGVAEASFPLGVRRLSADFNCTVSEPRYVIEILNRLRRDYPLIFERILYVEQPFPYDLQAHAIDVRDIARLKPIFLDESAHDWRHVELGRTLGYSGVCLKTCKTQTGSLLSLCWAKLHGMPLMVQDLTNPMLAQIPHVRLAAHAGTIHGVESNAMQFYPAASAPEAAVHPRLYERRGGRLDLGALGGHGFGYRIGQIDRQLPQPAAVIEP